MKKLYRFISLLLASVMISIFFVGCDFNSKDPIDDVPKTYVIQWTDDDGIYTLNVQEGMPYSIDHIPYREGYEFLGLFDAEVGGTQYISSNGASLSVYNDNRNLVLFPQYKAKEYTLQLNYGDVPYVGIDKIEVPYGEEIQGLPENFYLDDRSFSGWFSANDGSGVKVANGDIMNESLASFADSRNRITLYAKFDVMIYDVRFYSYDGNSLLAEKQVEHGTNIFDVAPKTLSDGSEIISWSTAKNGYGYEYNDDITDNGEFYVRDFRYVLTLNYGYDEKTETIRVSRGGTCDLPELSRNLYLFLGWFENETKVENHYTPERSTSLTAKWEKNFYSVTLDYNGHSSNQVLTVKKGESVNLPDCNISGYTFNGWKTSQGDKVSTYYTPTGDITLYADLTAKSSRITLDINGGDRLQESSKDLTYGSDYKLPVPTRSGYKFLGWFTGKGKNAERLTDANGQSLHRWSGEVSTAYALWTKNYAVALTRQSCKDNNGYDPSTSGTETDKLAHSKFDLIEFDLGGCVLDSDGSYFCPQGSSISLSVKVLKDISKLPVWDLNGKSINWTIHYVNSDSYNGTVYGTTLGGQAIGKGAYYIKISYTNGTATELKKFNFLAGSSANQVISIDPEINTSLKLSKIEAVFVYEIYYDYMSHAFDWNGTKCTANWRCSGSIKF